MLFSNFQQNLWLLSATEIISVSWEIKIYEENQIIDGKPDLNLASIITFWTYGIQKCR